MHTFTIRVIEEHRKALQDVLLIQENGNQIPTNINNVDSKERMALLDVLLQSTCEGKALTNEDIREEVDAFMFEGHDATTSALSFAFPQIARHPNVQQKLLEEICEVLDKDQSHCITYQVLQELKYTECVIKETLRLYPQGLGNMRNLHLALPERHRCLCTRAWRRPQKRRRWCFAHEKRGIKLIKAEFGNQSLN